MLKKHTRTPWVKEPWCIPEASAECVARMEDRLALDEKPADPTRPRACFEERPCQLLGEGHEPRPRVPPYPARLDYEYTRPGTWNLFMLVAPCQGWRHLTVSPRRTTQALAQGMAARVALPCPDAEKRRVVLDNLSTSPPAARSEVCPPADARRILRKREFPLTPGPGHWLKLAELALTVLARQCLSRRLPEAHTLVAELAVWEGRWNRHRATIAWRFTTQDARIKLKNLYHRGRTLSHPTAPAQLPACSFPHRALQEYSLP
jgi:hypothetical protein